MPVICIVCSIIQRVLFSDTMVEKMEQENAEITEKEAQLYDRQIRCGAKKTQEKLNISMS